MITGVDHVTVVVPALEPALADYARLTGVQPSWRGSHPELGSEAALFGMYNSVVELVAPLAGDERSEGLRMWLQAHGQGLSSLALSTPQAAACRSALREAGLRVAPVEHGEATGPDGSVRSYQSVELSPRDTRGLGVLAVQRSDTELLRGPSERGDDALYALDHVVIQSADPDAVVALYRDRLGLRLALDREVGGTRMLFFRTGKVTLEVLHDPQVGERDRLWGLAYRTRDLDGCHARLVAAGLDVSEPRQGTKPGTRVFTVRQGTGGVPTLVLHDPGRTD